MHSRLAITILVDNEATGELSPEHGLSLWLETSAGRILFDTGEGSALPGNASKLGIDLASADLLALSHGHYDHTGGICHVLGRATGVHLYGHPAALQPRYAILGDVAALASMPSESVSAVQQLPAERLHWTVSPTLISECIGLTGPIPRITPYEDAGGPFYLDEKKLNPDSIEDDQALWINTASGLVICVGCCHAGLVNTIHYVRHLTGVSRIRAIIGGFHLFQANDERLQQTIAVLQSLDPELIVPCHCSGGSAVEILQNTFGERVICGHGGATYEF
jgi:7,8-dihydropterin-6-yl-methyl-4-(beta-D-ribofuranosyl)aminobenzene 5'-phosphate synthase